MAKKSRLRRPTSSKRVKKQVAAPQARDAKPVAPGGAPDATRGLAAFQQGRYDDAIRAWQPATRSPDAPAALCNALAEAYFRRALGPVQPARRIADLRQAIALRPTHAVLYFHLALACQRDGQMRGALAAYEEAHRLAPADERFARHFALALVSSGDPTVPTRAQALLASARTGDETTARLRALSHLQEGEPGAALGAMAAVRPARPSRSATGATRLTPLGTLARSLAQLAVNQPDEALATLASMGRPRSRSSAGAILEPSPPILSGAAMLATVAAHLRRGDPDAASAALMAQEIPADPDLRRIAAHLCRHLAVELQLEERAEAAADVLDRALEAAPGH